jgi:hypothetical protein
MLQLATLDIEEIKKLPYSREYKRKLLLTKRGLCQKCGKANNSSKALCLSCRTDKNNSSYERRMPPARWDLADWSQPVKSIAKTVGRSVSIVYAYAKANSIKLPKETRWENLDWKLTADMTAQEIASLVGVSDCAVYWYAKKYGMPFKQIYKKRKQKFNN